MKINPDTFCSAAWFGIRNRQDMTKTVCCLLDWNTRDPGTEQMSPLDYLNSDKIKNMRKQMHKQIRKNMTKQMCKQMRKQVHKKNV